MTKVDSEFARYVEFARSMGRDADQPSFRAGYDAGYAATEHRTVCARNAAEAADTVRAMLDEFLHWAGNAELYAESETRVAFTTLHSLRSLFLDIAEKEKR